MTKHFIDFDNLSFEVLQDIIDCTQLLQKALDDELLINIAGNSIRMLPPLIITQKEVDILIKKIIKLIKA